MITSYDEITWRKADHNFTGSNGIGGKEVAEAQLT